MITQQQAVRRDPAEAVKLARRAVELTERRQPTALFTLARAQAAAGRYDLAVAAAEEALEVATKTGRNDLADRIRRRLTEYRNKTG